MKKLLKDYPFNTWMDAADGCDFCGAIYKVRVISINKKMGCGDVEYKLTHKEDCPERYEEGETVEDWDIAGWAYMDKPVNFNGKEYYPLRWRSNIGPCLECGKLIVGAPLIIFLHNGKGGSLEFCLKCAKETGILDKIVPNR